MSVFSILDDLLTTARGVALAIGPLAGFFGLFQVFMLDLPRREVQKIVKGTAVASAGLFLFLVGVGVGLMPFGQAIGEALGALPQQWLLAPFGAVLGFVTTWGEPAVRILANQVEEASAGSIRRSMVLWAVCLGVACAAGIGLLRISNGTPLLYIVAPGYALVIAMLGLCDRSFVGIAVDAGGVATGPLANTFLLALAFGASTAMGYADPMVQGLGLVALVALAPIVSVMALGLVVRWKEPRKES